MAGKKTVGESFQGLGCKFQPAETGADIIGALDGSDGRLGGLENGQPMLNVAELIKFAV